jgi:carboxyl-terminal processing protease
VGLTLDEAVDKMRGPVGSEIIITVVREGVPEPFDVSIIRDTIKLTAVQRAGCWQYHRAAADHLQRPDHLGVKEALAKGLEELGGIDNLEGVVLDLRNNPGGLLNEAITVVGRLP